MFFAHMAIARILKKGRELRQVTAKGLLVFKKDTMFLVTLKTTISNINSAGLNINYSELETGDEVLQLGFICTGITELTKSTALSFT